MLRAHYPVTLILFAIFCLTLPVSFIALHLATPSDGARLADGSVVYRADGVVVIPYRKGSDGLQQGDVVVAVGGRKMVDWVQDLFRSGAPRPDWQIGEEVPYTLIREGQELKLNVRLATLPLGAILARHWGTLLFAFVSQVVGVFVLLNKPREPAARALFIWAMSGSHTYTWSFFLQISDLVGGLGFWLFHLAASGLWLIYWAAALHVALVFPKPIPLFQRWPRLPRALYLVSFALFAGVLAWSWPRSANPLEWQSAWGDAGNLVAVLFLTATLPVVVIQYRRQQSTRERDQIRWAVFGAAISGAAGLLAWVAAPAMFGRALISPNILGLIALPFPLSLAIAIWRHHLFDIDVIINRTVVYSLLTGALAAIYFTSVILLQLVFPTQTQISVVVSTLGIAGLFSPLRSRIQYAIDRRFYRRKYDAEQALSSFSEAVREEVDLLALSERLVAVVEQTMQPEGVSLWLRASFDERLRTPEPEPTSHRTSTDIDHFS